MNYVLMCKKLYVISIGTFAKGLKIMRTLLTSLAIAALTALPLTAQESTSASGSSAGAGGASGGAAGGAAGAGAGAAAGAAVGGIAAATVAIAAAVVAAVVVAATQDDATTSTTSFP